jgi:hypothetical protein
LLPLLPTPLPPSSLEGGGGSGKSGGDGNGDGNNIGNNRNNGNYSIGEDGG